jgi:hypothetical protein
MNRRLMMSLTLGGALAACPGLVQAQGAPALPPRGEMLRGSGPGGDQMAPPMGMGRDVELLGFEGMRGGKVVTGAPFSGVAVTESTQTLADGNHITRKTQTNVFRDSRGRSRKEVAITGFAPLAASGAAKSFVVINDPVANASFVLHPDTKVAEKMGGHGGHGMKGPAKDGLKGKWQAREQQELASGNLKKEDLGTQTIAGVSAQGTRVTRTIPAGQMGNEKPIYIVHETWFSNDLQTVVMSKRSNPWIGETSYTLTNIQRTEPAASLFAVPADFTVKEAGPGKHGMGKFRNGTQPPPPANN